MDELLKTIRARIGVLRKQPGFIPANYKTIAQDLAASAESIRAIIEKTEMPPAVLRRMLINHLSRGLMHLDNVDSLSGPEKKNRP